MTKKTKEPVEEHGMAVAIKDDYSSFLIPTNAESNALVAGDDVLDLIDDEDFENYEEVREVLPFVSIRQKDLKNTKGKLIQSAGGFAYKEKAFDVVDVAGDDGLVVTMLATIKTRVYWKDLQDEHPTCKSYDSIKGINGAAVGNPSNDCATCPLAQWNDTERPECGTHMNILCLDHSMQKDNVPNPFYILNLVRSGLKHIRDFQVLAKKQKFKVGNKYRPIPLHFMKVHISTQYEAEPKEHYIPVFKIIETMPVDLIQMMKSHRKTMQNIFGRVIQTVELSDEAEQPGLGSETVDYDSLPDGVEPLDPGDEIRNDGIGKDGLPF